MKLNPFIQYDINYSGKDSIGFVIRVNGHLSSALQDWFGEVQMEQLENGTTLLFLDTNDQARLYGVLLRLRDLGIDLISVNPISN